MWFPPQLGTIIDIDSSEQVNFAAILSVGKQTKKYLNNILLDK